jgi:hypothetical protein
MNFLNDRRTVLALIGGALALLAGLGIAISLVSKSRGEKNPPPPASTGGLVVEAGPADDGKMDPARPLRCFVAGQFVGEVTLADCAKRNGVATGALDVGVDESGNLAAAGQAGTVLTPLPPETAGGPGAAPVVALTPSPAAAAAGAPQPVGPCLRYAGAEWRKLPGDLSLNACVQTLFAGHCERQGGATYGRWMLQTLRLVPGKVEVSADNRSFRTLAEQSPACVVAPVG